MTVAGEACAMGGLLAGAVLQAVNPMAATKVMEAKSLMEYSLKISTKPSGLRCR